MPKLVLDHDLHLVSPHMASPQVRAAQKLLRDNKYGKFYKASALTGKYDDDTAGAVKRARYMLGFAGKGLHGGFDQQLADYLGNAKKLPRLYALRRKHRIAAREARGNLKVKALKFGLKDKGVKESPPNSNRVKYSTWYGIIGPWCAMFQTYIAVLTGSKTFSKGARWAYVPYIVGAAMKHEFGMHITNDPEEGDLVTYDWDNDHVGDHVGRFMHWTNRGAGLFEALEGNTSFGNNSNGGEVMVRMRSTSDVLHFIHLDD
jgi:peptidoglycan hydrolase-like protein with peptidoglycan-binding domain